MTFLLTQKYYFYGEEIEPDRYALPPGTFGGLLPLGARNQVSGFIGSTGISTQFNFTGFKKHVITAGTGLNYYWTTPNTNKVNFIITPTFVQQIPLTEVSSLGNDPINKSDSRYNTYALAQDEWNFAKDWYLTAGFRYDYYSDVADGFSPRLSLVWNISPFMTAKLLYSRGISGSVVLGAKTAVYPRPQSLSLKRLTQWSSKIENKWSTDLKTSANAYWFEFENFISTLNTNAITPVGYINNPTINGVGVETEVNYRLRDSLNVAVNYSYHGITQNTNSGLLPEQHGKRFVKLGIFSRLVNWKSIKLDRRTAARYQ